MHAKSNKIAKKRVVYSSLNTNVKSLFALGSFLHIDVFMFWYLRRFTRSIVDLQDRWSNVTWLACFGYAEMVLCCSSSSRMIICHRRAMLKDATAGFPYGSILFATC